VEWPAARTLSRGFLALVFVLAGAGDARADGPAASDKPLAEGLFRQGKALADEGKLAEACERFAESQRIEPKLGTLLYLATCHEQVGKVATAWAEFEEAAAIAKKQRDAERVRIAQERAEKLLPRLPHLRVVVERDAAGAPDVFLDGRKLGDGSLGADLPVDPGPHRLDASRTGAETWSERFDVQEGASRELRVPVLTRRAKSAPKPTPVVSTEPAPSARAPSLRPLAIGAGVLGLAGLGVGTVFGIRYLGQRSDGLATCEGTRCTAEGLTELDHARTSSLVSTVGFAVGAVAAAACVTLIVLEPAKSSAAARASFGVSGRGAEGAITW